MMFIPKNRQIKSKFNVIGGTVGTNVWTRIPFVGKYAMICGSYAIRKLTIGAYSCSLEKNNLLIHNKLHNLYNILYSN